MSKFFATKTPNKKKNFFQNYYDHVSYLKVELEDLYKKLHKTDNAFKLLFNEGLKRLSVFDALRDGHDYFDEVLGATVMPIMAAGASLALLGLAIWEFVQSNSKSDSAALSLLVAAGAALLFSAAVFVKSAISLITRPIVTAIQGFKKPDGDRFYNEDDDLVKRTERVGNKVIDGVADFLGFGQPS